MEYGNGREVVNGDAVIGRVGEAVFVGTISKRSNPDANGDCVVEEFLDGRTKTITVFAKDCYAASDALLATEQADFDI